MVIFNISNQTGLVSFALCWKVSSATTRPQKFTGALYPRPETDAWPPLTLTLVPAFQEGWPLTCITATYWTTAWVACPVKSGDYNHSVLQVEKLSLLWLQKMLKGPKKRAMHKFTLNVFITLSLTICQLHFQRGIFTQDAWRAFIEEELVTV